MSSSCPPQLHLTLPANTTSFKRSFDQFGFDLESPMGPVEASSSGSHGAIGVTSSSRNERNKRARSASSVSEGNSSLSSAGSSGSSTLASGSSDNSPSDGSEPEPQPLSSSRPSSSNMLGSMPFEPPRLPTPDIQDIEMSDYPLVEVDTTDDTGDLEQPFPSAEGATSDRSFRSSLERLSRLSAIRSPRERTPTPPPTLPPLSLQDDDQTILHENVLPFLNTHHESSSPPLPNSLYNFGPHSSTSSSHAQRGDSRLGRNSSTGLSQSHILRDFHSLPTSRIPTSSNTHLSSSAHSQPLSSTARSNNSILQMRSEATSGNESLSDSLANEVRLFDANDIQSFGLGPFRNRTDDADNQSGQIGHQGVDVSSSSSSASSFARRIAAAPSTRSESPWRQAMLNFHIPQREREQLASANSRARAISRDRPSSSLFQRPITSPFAPPEEGPSSSGPNSDEDYRSESPPLWTTLISAEERASASNNDRSQFPSLSGSFSRGSRQGLGSAIPVSSPRPLSLHRPPSLGSLSNEIDRWFESPESPPTDTSQLPSLTGLDSLGRSHVRDDSPLFDRILFGPHDSNERIRRSDRDDLDSSASGLRARLLERRSLHDTESRFGSTLRTPWETSVDALDDPIAPSSTNRRRYIEQGLVDPREASERYRPRAYDAPENLRPSPRRWRFAWGDSWDGLNDEDSEISDSERIYRASRRMGRSTTRPLESSDRELGHSERSQTNANAPGLGSTLTDSRFLPRIRQPHNTYTGGPAGSTSLFSESAAEIRRRYDREILDHLRQSTNDARESSIEDDMSTRSSLFPRGPRRVPSGFSNPARNTLSRAPSGPRRPRSPSPPIYNPLYSDGMDDILRSNSQRTSLAGPARERDFSLPNRFEYSRTRTGQHEMDDPVEPASDMYRQSRALRRRAELSLEIPSRSSSHGRSRSFSTGPAGIFDSQTSSISDIARTITNNEDYQLPFTNLDLSTNSTSNVGGSADDTSVNSHSRSMHILDPEDSPVSPPSLPRPDLGTALFDSGDLSDISPISPSLPSDVEQYLERRRPETDRPRLEQDILQDIDRSPSPVSPLSPLDWMPSFELPSGSSFRRRNNSTSNTDHVRNTTNHTNIDLQSYAPGPYRNTLQRLIARNRMNEDTDVPSIPPLPFESQSSQANQPPFSSYTSRLRHVPQTQTQRSENHRSSSSTLQPSLGRRSSMPSHSSRATQRPRASEEASTRPDPHRHSDDLHRLITAHARLEASLLDGLPPLTAGSDRSIDQLSARSQQLIDQYHRQRRGHFDSSGASNSRPPTSSRNHDLWGSLEDGGDSGTRNNSNRPWYRAIGPRGSNTNTGPSANVNRSDPAALTSEPDDFIPLPGLRRRLTGTSPTHHERPVEDPRPLGPRRPFASRFGRHRMSGDLSAFGQREFESLAEFIGSPFRRRGRNSFNLGDFVRDEDMDWSYEGLLSLEAVLGEVKPKATPAHVIAGLETSFYKDWATDDSDKRCPICLDDYKPLDPVLKLRECNHWLHKPCLEQWLKGASTCPVCREAVREAVRETVRNFGPPPELYPSAPRRREPNLQRRNTAGSSGRTTTGPSGPNTAPTGSGHNNTNSNSNGRRNSTDEGADSTSPNTNVRASWRFSRGNNSNWRHAFGPRPPPDSNN